jgi:hypothetical protein
MLAFLKKGFFDVAVKDLDIDIMKRLRG